MKGVCGKVATAYILLNTEIGSENQVLKALKKIEGVEEAYHLWGVYDIIANVKADSLEKLKQIITKKIEKVSSINSKLTMLMDEKHPTQFENVVLEQNPIPI